MEGSGADREGDVDGLGSAVGGDADGSGAGRRRQVGDVAADGVGDAFAAALAGDVGGGGRQDFDPIDVGGERVFEQFAAVVPDFDALRGRGTAFGGGIGKLGGGERQDRRDADGGAHVHDGLDGLGGGGGDDDDVARLRAEGEAGRVEGEFDEAEFAGAGARGRRDGHPGLVDRNAVLEPAAARVPDPEPARSRSTEGHGAEQVGRFDAHAWRGGADVGHQLEGNGGIGGIGDDDDLAGMDAFGQAVGIDADVHDDVFALAGSAGNGRPRPVGKMLEVEGHPVGARVADGQGGGRGFGGHGFDGDRGGSGRDGKHGVVGIGQEQTVPCRRIQRIGIRQEDGFRAGGKIDDDERVGVAAPSAQENDAVPAGGKDGGGILEEEAVGIVQRDFAAPLEFKEVDARGRASEPA